MAIKPARASVKAEARGATYQPTSVNSTSAAGTRLRRRLSKIFQRDSPESGFRSLRPSAAGTRGKSQLTICQSPRIHRLPPHVARKSCRIVFVQQHVAQ